MSLPEPLPVVFLLDCDDTLLDNDALKADLERQLGALLGPELNAQLWQLYEAVRLEEDMVDLPRTLDRFAAICPDAMLAEQARSLVMNYPFADRLYPGALAALAHLRAIGMPCVLSDGDTVFQPRKIEGSGLAAACAFRVLIYMHKQQHLNEVMARWPGAFYVAIDDKARILADIKRQYPERFATVQMLQGHYAMDPTAYSPPPDLKLDHIGDLCAYGADAFRALLSTR